jgi:hypothetical protein
MNLYGVKKEAKTTNLNGTEEYYATTPAAHWLEELFSAVLERFLQPIHALRVYCKK